MRARIFLLSLIPIYGCTSTPEIVECENISHSEKTNTFILPSKKTCNTTVSLKKNTSYVLSATLSDDWADGDKYEELRRPALDESGWVVGQLPWFAQGITLVEPFRRCPNGRWFEIIGEVKQPSGPPIKYRLGQGMRDKKVFFYNGPDDGRLMIYANDLNCRYENNIGEMTMSVRLATEEEITRKEKFPTCE